MILFYEKLILYATDCSKCVLTAQHTYAWQSLPLSTSAGMHFRNCISLYYSFINKPLNRLAFPLPQHKVLKMQLVKQMSKKKDRSKEMPSKAYNASAQKSM